MALETVVFPQEMITNKEVYAMGGLAWGANCSSSMMQCNFEEWGTNSSTSPETGGGPATGRRKRRRAKVVKNKEEVESQRMNHIAIERNRRKQMNEYLAVLRSLMPPSYVQRGDQASIVGGAINFVKELEQHLQSLEVKKRTRAESSTPPFADFFTFPQYTCSLNSLKSGSGNPSVEENEEVEKEKKKLAMADIEVTMVESHANLKILVKRRPKQLLRVVVGLQNMRLAILHLNATTADQMVLYSFSLKVEESCELSSVDDIAMAVHEMIGCTEMEYASSS
ncbi:hypothetical protein LUZ60_001217 [Juncus effusus]|nr:hypothetical protein LUZ60_001217 [Juncus effusus]